MRVRGASSSRLCSRRAVAALALVALICGATLAGSARSQRQTPLRSGPPFALDAYTRMVVKYYEEIKLNDAGDRAVLYDDLGKGKGNCTIGWGRLVHNGPCDGRGSEKPYLDGITLETAESYLTQDIQRVARSRRWCRSCSISAPGPSAARSRSRRTGKARGCSFRVRLERCSTCAIMRRFQHTA